jgi:hypothetical protein
MTIATQADVEALLLRPLTAGEATYIGDLLARADALIYRELPGVQFTGILTGQTATLDGKDDFEVWIPGRPVRAVASVTLNGATLVYGTDYDWSEFGDLARTSDTKIWPRASTIRVVHDYGYAAPPEDVVAVAADIVKGGIANPSGYRQESVGSWSATYAEAVAAAMGLQPNHVATLDHYRFPVAF